MKIDKSIEQKNLRPKLEGAFAFGLKQLERMQENWPVGKPAPIYTENGKWIRPDFMWTDWCPGFYAGLMWLAFEHTADARWYESARAYTLSLEHRKFDRDVHDLGFIFMSTVNRWLGLVDDDDPVAQRLTDWLITAATIQSFRWKETGDDHYIYSFNGPQSLFIDVMMNIRLLFRAHQLGGSETLYQKAVTHAKTSEKYLIQKDGPRIFDENGSTMHEAIFNPVSGEFRCLSTQQGYSPFTCWSRGLAWAIHGYIDTFFYTGDAFFLETAERCADFYFKNTPDHGVPYWDYGAPNIPNEPFDSSAAAIIAGGFWKLRKLRDTRRPCTEYRDAALTILKTLCGDAFLGTHDPDYEGILRHGVYHLPRNWGVDESVLWGEYFFMEALYMVLSEAS